MIWWCFDGDFVIWWWFDGDLMVIWWEFGNHRCHQTWHLRILRQWRLVAGTVIELGHGPSLRSIRSRIGTTIPWEYGRFHKWGYPKMDRLYGKTIYKWRIWGYPYFRNPPSGTSIWISVVCPIGPCFFGTIFVQSGLPFGRLTKLWKLCRI